MLRTDKEYGQYVQILREELVPAMGCTEPIAIAYCAAKARSVLGMMPEKVIVAASGNIIKNVKSVIVPHTGGLRGIDAAAAAGIAAGREDALLEVLSDVTPEQVKAIHACLHETDITVDFADTGHVLDISVTVCAGEESACVQIQDAHTNIVLIEKNDEVLYRKAASGESVSRTDTDRSVLTVEKIVEFADCLEPEDVREIFDRQISYNMAIANEGMTKDYGANIGKILLRQGNGVLQRAKAMAAAGSDARMNGCELPVVINSGSGNQGITASVPVIIYAKELGAAEKKLYQALAVSNLCTIHIKQDIGKLSAYCGAVSAGCGSGAGITYLQGGGFKEVAHTLVNALAMISGTVCDGAKSSCAAKIAFAVEAGVLGNDMYKQGNQFYGGDGLVKKGVENTIHSIGRLASIGMCETDKEIIQIMVGR